MNTEYKAKDSYYLGFICHSLKVTADKRLQIFFFLLVVAV